MKNKLEQTIVVAKYLDDSKNISILEHMLNTYQNKQFYLPFIGQFSAGKSRLINELLGEKILPVRLTETTSAITEISYGNNAIVLHMKDGSTDCRELSDLLQIYQGNSELEIETIQNIDVALENELLQAGMILVDTPGLNTIIEQHERFSYEILPYAGAVIYVMEKSLTQTDKRIIENLGKLGIKLIFVRTKIDLIHDTEDELDSVLEKDKNTLKSVLADKNDLLYYAVSVEDSSITPADRKMSWQAFENYLKISLVDNITAVCEVSTQHRLEKICSELQEQLKRKLVAIQSQKEKSIQEIEANLIDVNRLEEDFLDNKKAIALEQKRKLSKLNSYLIDSTEMKVQQSVHQYENKLQQISDRNELYKNGNELMRKDGDLLLAALKKNISVETKQYFSSLKQEYITCLQGLASILEVSADMQDVETEQPQDIDSISQYMDEKIYFYQQNLADLKLLSHKNDNELKNMGLQRDEIEQLLKETAEQKNAASSQINELGPYVPNMIQIEGNDDGSKLGRKIGDTLDVAITLAMLFCPATTASGAAKGAALAGKGAKIVKNVSKVNKILATTRKAVDGVKKVAELVAQRKKEKMMETSPMEQGKEGRLKFLDYLDLGHWGETIGSTFDTPAILQEDLEFKREYVEAQGILNRKYNDAIENQVRKEREKQILISDLAEKQRRQELLVRKEKQIQVELEKKQQEIRNKQLERDMEKHRHQLCDQYKVKGKALQEHLMERWEQYMHENMMQVVLYNTLEVEKGIHNERASLEDIIVHKNERKSCYQQKEQEISGYMKILQQNAL
ncbi:Dynamin family protein [Propionispira arboris]|uniref:Dynamin family protein n=1 Tax=Propionispira arboris TaxID=84035 RepID=A0A1H6ZYS5_9FIRM|nr:dynamin family protein [Propionispira arboris]SEJ54740.1 Dynamin family protein [Propionispira arboris]